MRTQNGQTDRLWRYLQAHPNQDLDQPTLNRAAAGAGGLYVNSFTRRISDCRKLAQAQGGDVVLSKDYWENGQRKTAYRYTPKPECVHFWSIADDAGVVECLWCYKKAKSEEIEQTTAPY